MIQAGDKLVMRTFEPGLVGYLLDGRWAMYRARPAEPDAEMIEADFEGYRDVDPADLRAAAEMREGLRPWDDLAA
jgi:hypothetical protein